MSREPSIPIFSKQSQLRSACSGLFPDGKSPRTVCTARAGAISYSTCTVLMVKNLFLSVQLLFFQFTPVELGGRNKSQRVWYHVLDDFLVGADRLLLKTSLLPNKTSSTLLNSLQCICLQPFLFRGAPNCKESFRWGTRNGK